MRTTHFTIAIHTERKIIKKKKRLLFVTWRHVWHLTCWPWYDLIRSLGLKSVEPVHLSTKPRVVMDTVPTLFQCQRRSMVWGSLRTRGRHPAHPAGQRWVCGHRGEPAGLPLAAIGNLQLQSFGGCGCHVCMWDAGDFLPLLLRIKADSCMHAPARTPVSAHLPTHALKQTHTYTHTRARAHAHT